MAGAPSLLTICALSLFLLVDKACGQVYPSLQWFPNNPIFMTNMTDCVPEMKVLPNSKINVICPTTVTILETVQSPKPKHELYENLWIIYDNKSFEKCDANMTNAEPPQKASRLLMECDKPLELKYFTVVFQEFSAVSGGLEFKPGREYYFLATSDGTQGSLDSGSGGHCNDTRNGVAMKFKVYVCINENDTKCADETYETFGMLKCPSKPTTNPPSTTTTTEATTMAATTTAATTTAATTTAATTTAATTTATTTATTAAATTTTTTATDSVTTEPGSETSTTEPDATAILPKKGARTEDARTNNMYMIFFIVTLLLLVLVVCIIMYRNTKRNCIKPCQCDPELGQNGTLTTKDCELTNPAYRVSTCSMDFPDGTVPDQQFKSKEKPLNNGVKKEAPTKPTELKEKLPNNNISREVNVTDKML